MLNESVHDSTDNKVMDEEGGYIAGKGCTDEMFVVRQTVEKTILKNKKMHARGNWTV